MATTSGELLGGKFRPLGERIAFPFGTWWDAEDDQGARTLVLRLHAGVTDAAAKVKAAIDAAHKIDSPHIVPWTAGGVDAAGAGWLAAPMYGPWSLSEHVTRGEGIRPTEAAPLLHQVARALAAAETAGVPHHCLASEFIRLVPIPDAGNGIKIYGFGLADVLPSYKGVLRRQEFHVGVPDYMAPEVCDGKAPEGASADIYATGILMYEAVRGRPPFAPTFASASVSTTIKRHQFEKALPLHVRYANAPFIKSYETICFKALDKKANRRQLSLAEFERELEALVTTEMRLSVLPLEAIAAKSPTTVRRHRTQILPLVPSEDAHPAQAPEALAGAKVVHAAAAAERAAEQAGQRAIDAPTQIDMRAITDDDDEDAGPSVVVAGGEELEPEAEGEFEAEPERDDEPEQSAAPAAAEARRESTLAYSGAAAMARQVDAQDEGEGDEERAARSPAVVGGGGGADAGGGGKKSKKQTKKSKRPTTTIGAATASTPSGDAGRSAATVTDKPAVVVAPTVDAGARVRRPMDKTVPASPAAFAAMTEQRLEGKKAEKTALAAAAPAAKTVAPVKTADAQDAWFDASPGDEGGAKKSRAWVFLVVAALAVAVVVFLIAKGGGGDPAGVGTVGTTRETRYGLEGGVEGVPTTAPATTATASADAGAAVAPDAGATMASDTEAAVDTAPAPDTQAALIPTTAPDTTVAAAEPVPAEDTTPATRADTAPAARDTAPAARDTAPTHTDTAPAAKDTTVAAADTGPTAAAETGGGDPEDLFKKKAKDYIQKGIAAYQNNQYKLAAGWFKKALEADSSNVMAARYLKEAEAKLAPP